MNLTKPINKEVIAMLKKGDSKSFELVFREMYEPLVHFTDEYLRDIEAAKNIAQNLFLKLWEMHSLIDPESNLKAYLYKAARNASISYLRHLKIEKSFKEKSLFNDDERKLNYEALQDLNLDKIDLDKLELIIKQAIEELPERCREVFMLSRFEELKNKEIADKLQISVKAVEANITRALVKLRLHTKDYLPDLLVILLFGSKF